MFREELGEGFSLDYARALAWLETEPASREAQVLRYQLMRYGRM